MFIEILFKMLLFKGGVLIYAEHCNYNCSMRRQRVNEEGQVLSWEDSHIYTSAGGLAEVLLDQIMNERLKKMFHVFVLFCLCWCRQIGKLLKHFMA